MLSILLTSVTLTANDVINKYKLRLSDIVNSYQPTIQPVLSPDNKYLFIDRKFHPDNVGGVKDKDDIWFSRITYERAVEKFQNLGSQINSPGSDVLFKITPSGNALIYSEKDNESGRFYLARWNDSLLYELTPIIIDDYYNESKNFYANLSADGRIMILSLKRKDSQGNMDLYVSFRYDNFNNRYSKPKNIGMQINTTDNEISPFLAYDNRTLYFAGNGHKSYGGKDIFVTRRLDDSWTNWTTPINLGRFINTEKEDYGIYLTSLGDSALINSWDDLNKREGIYFINIPDSLQPYPYAFISSKIRLENGSKLDFSDVIIQVTYDNKKHIDTLRPLIDGRLYFTVERNSFCSVIISKPGYDDFGFAFNTTNLEFTKIIPYNILLRQSKSSKILLTRFYFDYDSSLLTKDNSTAIETIKSKVIFPENSKLLIVGHTDLKGSDDYNYKLAENRALEVYNYLLTLGFKKDNLTVISKGKTQPYFDKDELNRRVEVFLIDN